MRRSLTVATAVLALAIVVVGTVSIVAPPEAPMLQDEQSDPPYLELNGTETEVWPYHNKARQHEPLSPINVFVRADVETVVDRLTDAEGWDETPEEERDAAEETFSAEELETRVDRIEWDRTTGSDRYTAVRRDGEVRWVEPDEHLHFGTYYGSRNHLRLYPVESASGDDWVAIQAHTEHFDWFTLRHAVDGYVESQRQVESDFRRSDDAFVWRRYADNEKRGGFDGWATVVEFLVLVPVLGLSLAGLGGRARGLLEPADRRRLRGAGERVTLRHGALAGAILGLVLGVRLLGVLLEWYAPLSMHAIAALLYPWLALGVPIATYGIATGLLRRIDAALVAAGAMSLAVVIDYSVLGVEVIPLQVVLHRAGVIVALGLLAGGAARRATRERRLNDMVVAGTGLWVLLLLSTLLGWV